MRVGFLLKNSDADHLIDAVRTVASGNALLAPEVTSRVIAKMTATRASRARDASLESLTPREREVLELVGRGRSNAEIAADLVLGEATVKTHLSNAFAKLHLRDRVHAVVYAYETGLIRPGDGDLRASPPRD